MEFTDGAVEAPETELGNADIDAGADPGKGAE